MTHKQIHRAVFHLSPMGTVESIEGEITLMEEAVSLKGKHFDNLHPVFGKVGYKALQAQRTVLVDMMKEHQYLLLFSILNHNNQSIVTVTEIELDVETSMIAALLKIDGIGCWVHHLKDNVSIWNNQMQQLAGITGAHSSVGIAFLEKLLARKDFENIKACLSKLEKNENHIFSHMLVQKELSDSLYIEFYIERKGDLIIGLCRNVTHGYLTQEHFHLAFENSSIGMALVKPGGELYEVNESLCAMLGYPKEELKATDFQTLTHPDDLAEDLNLIKKVLSNTIPGYQLEKRYITKEGKTIWAILNVSLVRDANKKPLYFISQIQDITKRKEYERHLESNSKKDNLTGLCNRKGFFEHIQKLKRDKACFPEKVAAVINIDLDEFAKINEFYGVDVGDKVIEEIARRLKSCAEKDDLVARLGGDEFALFIVRKSEGEIISLMDKVLVESRKSFVVENYEFTVCASAGASIYPNSTTDIEELLSQADISMGKVKKAGGGSYTIYTKAVRDEEQLKNQIEHYLKEAVEAKELKVVYQPQFDIKTLDCIGFEALVRWKCKNLPEIGPDTFIPVAEEGRFIQKIDLFVFEQALIAMKDSVHRGAFTCISVNLSAFTLSYRGIVNDLNDLAKKHRFPTNQIILEVTETKLLDDIVRAKKTLQAFSRLGFKIAVDDFGTGYSSLQYLREFKVDIIKIDKSFIQKMENDKQTQMVIKAAIDMGQAIGSKVLAEGVETALQHQLLLELGCHEVQGYLFGKPSSSPFETFN